MKNNSIEMPNPSPEVLAKMIQDLKFFNAAIERKKYGEETKSLRGNYYLRENYDKEWLNALPLTFSKERDVIIGLLLDLGEIVAGHNIKMAQAIFKYAASIHTDNDSIASDVFSMFNHIKEMSTDEDVVEKKKKNKATFVGYFIVLYIIFKIVRILFAET